MSAAIDYCLPNSYRANLSDQSVPVAAYTAPPPNFEYQGAVYRYAARLARNHGLRRILDVGCGSGLKILTYLAGADREITGLDDKVCIDHCRATHATGRWLVENFDRDAKVIDEKFDLIICADVIEHVVYPERLVAKIVAYAHPETHIVLSTPDRLRLDEPRPLGPPANPLHVREWTLPELARFISAQGITIVAHRYVPQRDLTWRQMWWELRKGNTLRSCQMLHGRVTR
jgi:2-polyprenyl-3-methyl-5-hydroxy-6-metoxy-1,4-benzoquinol methylase